MTIYISSHALLDVGGKLICVHAGLAMGASIFKNVRGASCGFGEPIVFAARPVV